MTPPLCIVCEKVPVKRVARQNRSEPQRGWRVIDGERWNWTCGKVCQATDASDHVSRDGLHAGHREWRVKRFKERLDALVAELKAHADQEERVPLPVAARLIIEREKAAEHRGMNRMRQRINRGAAA